MIDQETRNRLESNWRNVQREVNEAANRCGRDPSSVTIIGVSKYVDAELTKALYAAGCGNLGESRPQSLWEKAAHFDEHSPVRWHLIGHLQRNKIRRTLPLAPLIHSIDGERLLDAICEQAKSLRCSVSVLLEVNISGEQAKTGMSPTELDQIMAKLPLPQVQVLGLMAMAGWGTEPAVARRQFDQLRHLRDQVQGRFDHPLPELSMGMSGDFAEAIEAGATMVRIGSRLFDGILPR